MIEKIVSGGQSGADRAGLEAASFCGIPTGGWAPKGWVTQTFDGQKIADRSLSLFGLKEYPVAGYPPRTKANVQDSDGTVLFGHINSPGARLTSGTARRLGKPLIINPTATELSEWSIVHQIKVLNVAGNRLSELNADIYWIVFKTIVEAFGSKTSTLVSEIIAAQQEDALLSRLDKQRTLNKLMEECGEVIQAAAKFSAFPGNDHPSGQDSVQMLTDEIGDVLAAASLAIKVLGLDATQIEQRCKSKQKRFIDWFERQDHNT